MKDLWGHPKAQVGVDLHHSHLLSSHGNRSFEETPSSILHLVCYPLLHIPFLPMNGLDVRWVSQGDNTIGNSSNKKAKSL
jgi:hypothetical protein